MTQTKAHEVKQNGTGFALSFRAASIFAVVFAFIIIIISETTRLCLVRADTGGPEDAPYQASYAPRIFLCIQQSPTKKD